MANSTHRSGGGAATTSGITFQEKVAAYFATLILAESSASPPTSLPAHVYLTAITCETARSVDDLTVNTSANGRLFIQSKTSVSVSEDEDSELAKVLVQFIEQYHAGDTVGGVRRRDLDPVLDRLVLAVSAEAPATLRDTLRGVLDKCHTVSTDDQFADLQETLNDDEKAKLRIVRSHLQRIWRAQAGADLTFEKEVALLRLVYVLPLDMRNDGSEYNRAQDLLKSVVLHDPARSGDAWNAVIRAAQDWGPNRTGGDLHSLRELLGSLPLKSVSSFIDDIVALKRYSTSSLRYLSRLSSLRLPDRAIKISRPVVQALGEFVRDGDVAVVGEPGAGKSGCVFDYTSGLRDAGADVVVIAADNVDASTPEALARDLGLSNGRRLDEILRNWSGNGNGYLVIDALDAARARVNLHSLCVVLNDIREATPRWRIVVSIREFDLRMSDEVQDLFRGSPHPLLADPGFPTVRHIRVNRLTDEELAQVSTADRRISAILSTCSNDLRELLRNPFNLSLLCQLVGSVSEVEITAVRAQVSLLDLYWRARVESGDRNSRLLVLDATVTKLVAARELRIEKLAVLQAVPTATPALDTLLTDGVLVEPDPAGVAQPSLAFSHNILFDYAVARLWVGSVSDQRVTTLSSAEHQDLLVAIRPSIIFAFERLWVRAADTQAFWERALVVQQSSMRLIGKIIALGVAAEHFRVVADVAPLMARIATGDSHAFELLHALVTAGMTRHESAPGLYPITGESAPEWLPLAALLAQHVAVAGWDIRGILWPIARRNLAMTSDQLNATNEAALALVNDGLTDPRHTGWVRIGLEAAVKTINANPIGTEAAVRRILAPEMVALGGHEWLGSLTEHVEALASYAPAAAVDLVEVLFSVDASRDDQVRMGGRLLALTFNKRDMFGMAKRHVAERFESIMRGDPLTATLIMLKVVEAEARKTDSTTRDDGPATINLRGKTIPFRPDGSHYWHEGSHSQHEDWWIVLNSFQAAFVELSRSGDTGALVTIVDLLRDNPPPPIVWSRVIRGLGDAPDALAPLVGDLLANLTILVEHETAQAARRAIPTAYGSLSRDQRRELDQAILAISNAADADYRPYAEQERDRIIASLPLEFIERDEVREIRTRTEPAPASEHEDDNIEEGTWGDINSVVERHRYPLERKPENKQLMELARALQDIPRSTQGATLTSEDAAKWLPAITALEDGLARAAEDGVDNEIVEQCHNYLADACARLSFARPLTREDPIVLKMRQLLLTAATDIRPEPKVEDDEWWNKSVPPWSPAPRIDAALGLMALAADAATVDEEILKAIDLLSRDPVPAVRFQVLTRVAWLFRTAPEHFESIVDYTANHENRIAVLSSFANHAFFRLPPDPPGRRERAVIRIYERKRSDPEASEIRRVAANFFMLRAVYDNDELANRRIAEYAEHPCDFPDEVGWLVHLSRHFIRFSSEKLDAAANARIRAWAFGFLATTTQSLKRELDALKAKYPPDGELKWDDKEIGTLRSLYILAHDVARQLRYSCRTPSTEASEDDDSDMSAHTDSAVLFTEATPLLDALCNIECVQAAYDALQTLEFFIDTAPKRVLLYSASLVRCASLDNLQHESMAADLAVKIVERYLADYAELIRTDTECREALLNVLDVFVAVGWPSALRLTHRLVDIFR